MVVEKKRLGDLLLNFDYLRKPLSSLERQSFQGEYPYYGAQGIIDYVKEYRCDGEYLLIAEDGENLSSRNEPIAQIAIGKFWVNNHAHVVKANSDADLRYICYALNHSDITGYVTGSAQPKLSQANLNKITLNVPHLVIQRRIASILSAYDNLIENNNRRIRLLEQMAENLYKEWFVRFRFPGHEKVEFENGLPKGWIEEVASNVIDVMSGGTPKTEREDFYGGDIPFYTPKDANDSIFVYSTITNITEEGLAHCNSQYYPVNTLMITARGTVGKLSLLAVPMAMNQSCFALKFKDDKNPYYLYYSIKNEVSKLKKMANGGVFDTIIVKTFDHIKIIVPSEKMLEAFDKDATPILEQIQQLQRQSISLSRQRDLLLPRLMSGKLEVKV